jgi:hypothetical protein
VTVTTNQAATVSTKPTIRESHADALRTKERTRAIGVCNPN